MQKIVGVKKLGDSNMYYFLYGLDLNLGDKVVVEFEEFQTIATVERLDVKFSQDASELGKVLRIATDADLKKYQTLFDKAKEDLPKFKKKSLELGLMMKFVGAEYSLDNSKIIIYFSSEDRVDFRQLLKDLASMLKTRIELKQIGQRDEVKMVSGVGPCGEHCCCARFLKDFEHVTVKMAKVQGLSLSPTKINGVCGRLMCCLGYESPMYEEQLKKMPRINAEVTTPNGKGIVVYNDLLREKVSVKRQAEGDTIVIEEFELGDLVGYESSKKVDDVQDEKDLKTEDSLTEKNEIEEVNNREQVVEDVKNQKNEEKKDFHQKKKFNKNFSHKNFKK